MRLPFRKTETLVSADAPGVTTLDLDQYKHDPTTLETRREAKQFFPDAERNSKFREAISSVTDPSRR